MTASPPLNGQARPPIRIVGDWQPVTPEPEPAEEQCSPQPEPAVDAEVARARAWAEAEERRVAAEAAKEERLVKAKAEADAIRAKAEEDARRLRLNNDKLERKAREEEEATQARIAESRKRKADADRAREEADRIAAEQQAAAETEAAEVEEAENQWRGYARSFYIVCAIVALPVQVAAFYNPHALWLMAAPLMLEGGAWVVLKGAAAAVAGHRPHWHYRLIAWLLAFIAAGINLWHGLNAFDPATAIGTAFASVAGPGVWDLHEHGRIRKRDGVPTRRERKAAEKAAKAEAARKAAEEKQRAAEKAAADKAAEEARQKLREIRQTVFKDVWAEAVRIGAALGKEPDDPAVWPRAYRNIKGCEPGESIESITARRTAEKRVEAALTGTPVTTLSKTTNAQRAIQVKGSRATSSYTPVPPRRTRGDTPKFHRAARALAAEAKRAANARQKDDR
jgi:chemotaxis protein histidine kinase CheA